MLSAGRVLFGCPLTRFSANPRARAGGLVTLRGERNLHNRQRGGGVLQGRLISLRVSAELLFTRRHGYCVSLAGRLPDEDPFPPSNRSRPA